MRSRRKRGRLCGLLGMLLLLTCSATAQSSLKSIKAPVTELLEACRSLDEALVKADTGTLSSLVHTQLSLGHSNGMVEDRAALLRHLSSGYLRYREIVSSDTPVVQVLREQASVRRKLSVSGTLLGYDFNVDLDVLEVWIREEGSWRLWCRQSVKQQ